MEDLWTMVVYGVITAAVLLCFYQLVKAAVRNGVKEALRDIKNDREADEL